MSIKLMSVVWELDLPPGEKLVLLALADQANDAGENCWPSLSTIAHRSGQNERTVRRALRSLEDRGLLTAHFKTGKSTHYSVHPGHDARPTPDTTPPGQIAPRTNATETPDTTPPKPLEPSSPTEANASSGDSDRATPEEIVGAWNEMANRLGLPTVRKIDGDRRKKLVRYAKRYTLDEWAEAMKAVERSEFLHGDNPRGWRPGLDFLLQPSSFTKLIEGSYDRAA